MNYNVVVVAAGKGMRAGLSFNKVLRRIAGKSVLLHALKAFHDDPDCTRLIVVTSEQDLPVVKSETAGFTDAVLIGGKTRRESVREGLKHVDEPHVMIHDGARPFVSSEVLERLKETLRHHDAASAALVVPDTLKKVDNGIIMKDVDRKGVYGLQTPQAFSTHILKEAHVLGDLENLDATCDLSLVNKAVGLKGVVVEGDPRSMKYTHERDLKLLEMILDDANRSKP